MINQTAIIMIEIDNIDSITTVQLFNLSSSRNALLANNFIVVFHSVACG